MVAKKPRLEKEHDLEDETQTLIIDKEVEEGDEVSEVKVIYESAVEKLGNVFMRDSRIRMGCNVVIVVDTILYFFLILATTHKAALPLLRGTIHECDRILRNRHVTSPLPASFHLTYGSALFDMGTVLEEEEDPAPYWDAARERLEIGLESVEKAIAEEKEDDEGKREKQEVEKELRMVLGRALVSKVGCRYHFYQYSIKLVDARDAHPFRTLPLPTGYKYPLYHSQP